MGALQPSLRSAFGITAASLMATALLLTLGDVRVEAAAAANYGQGQFGSLELCPPGGPNFMMAWSLACEMKRRKKREVESAKPSASVVDKRMAAGYRAVTLEEIQKICCEVGCEIRDLLSYCDPFGPWNSR